MPYAKRQGRSLFAAFLCSAWVLVMLAPPLVAALEPASGGSTRDPSFARIDRNGDGFVSPREATAVRGLKAVLPHADGNRDGRLDQVEYARALGMGAPAGAKGRGN